MSLFKGESSDSGRYYDYTHYPLVFPFECYRDYYQPIKPKDGKIYRADSYMVAGNVNRLIRFPHTMSFLKFRLMFPTSKKNIYFSSCDDGLYEYFTGHRIDVLSYNFLYNLDPNVIDDGIHIMVLAGEDEESLKRKNVTSPFVHNIDLFEVSDNEFDLEISKWESKPKKLATFKEEFSSFCEETEKAFSGSAYILKKPQ